MNNFIISNINQFGYWGIFLLIFSENVFPPIPSEVILIFGGFLTTYTKLNLFGVILSSVSGALLGAIFLYYVGKILSKERLEKIVSGKVGKILHLKINDIDKAEKRFKKRGGKAVFLCRFVPLIRSLISVPAGIAKMPISKFLLYTTCGTLIWNSVLIIIGREFGEKWESIAATIEQYSSIFGGFLGISAIIFLLIFCFKRKS